jgi:hypothetical protein
VLSRNRRGELQQAFSCAEHLDRDSRRQAKSPSTHADPRPRSAAPPPPYCSSKLAELLTAQAYKEGVLSSAGTDSFAPAEDPYPALQGEIEILVHKVGMTPLDALRSATVISAMSMGQQAEMGTLNPASWPISYF